MKWKRRCELRQSQRTARLSIRKRMGLFHLSGTDRRLPLPIRRIFVAHVYWSFYDVKVPTHNQLDVLNAAHQMTRRITSRLNAEPFLFLCSGRLLFYAEAQIDEAPVHRVLELYAIR
jgi:hypothetical protein